MVDYGDVGGSGTRVVRLMYRMARRDMVTYVSILSNPSGSYTDTFCVRRSDILFLISLMVDCFRISA